MNRLVLIRHTSVAVQRGHCYGNFDIGVSENFMHEAQILQSNIKHFAFNKIFTSPLTRCKLLADFLFPTSTSLEDLKEINYGLWENTPWATIGVKEGGDWIYHKPITKAPQGESFACLQQRVINCLHQHILNHQQESIALVIHGGVIRTIIAYLCKLSLSSTQHFKIHYASYVELIQEGNIWKIKTIFNQ